MRRREFITLLGGATIMRHAEQRDARFFFNWGKTIGGSASSDPRGSPKTAASSADLPVARSSARFALRRQFGEQSV